MGSPLPHLILGFGFTYNAASKTKAYSIIGEYTWDRFKFFFQDSPLTIDRAVLGVQVKCDDSLDLYAEFKVDKTNK